MDKTDRLEIALLKLAPEVEVVATADGLLIRYIGRSTEIDLSHRSSWAQIMGLTDRGKILAQYVEGLVLEELAFPVQSNLIIRYHDLPKLDELSADFLEGAVEASKFAIRIEKRGTPGHRDFKFTYEFLRGRRIVFPDRVGPFLVCETKVYRLSHKSFELLDEIDVFNSLKAEERASDRVYQCLARIKGLQPNAEDIDLDNYLKNEQIIIPQRINVDIVTHENGFISLFPAFEGVSPELSKREFFKFGRVQTRYDIQPESGKRIRVIIPEVMFPILEDIQQVRRVGGADRDRILVDPKSCFSDGVDRDLIEVVDFGPRVKGICHIPQKAQIVINAQSRHWSGIPEDDESSGGPADSPPLTIRLKLGDEDGSEDIQLSAEQFREFSKKAFKAKADNSAKMDWGDSHIFVDDDLLSQVRDHAELLDRKSRPDFDLNQELRRGVFLDIHHNFETTTYIEGVSEDQEVVWSDAELPWSLRSNIEGREGKIEPLEVKPHQIDGIAWLQNMFRNRATRRGCLLADDMGLGKTLQILAFLAWCVEKEYKRGLGAEQGPYEPILIIAPIILIDNWKGEIERFFRENGVFHHRYLAVHGSELKRLMLRELGTGREIKDGKQKLDLDQIREHRVIITNYDTVKNYQHSFGRVPWSIIVTDEAQEIKVQNQKSFALKALKAKFRIVATGTPVENRLLDLWNLVDFMHSGNLLGSAREFHNRYEKDLHERSPEERREVSEALKNVLGFGQKKAFILRREKGTELKDLPHKEEMSIICEITDSVRQKHLDIVAQISESQQGRNPFGLLDQLKKLYLHPCLLNSNPVDDYKALVAESTKLQRMIQVIEQIRRKGEKVLIFAILSKLQAVLATVLEQHFGFKIEIVSGSSNSSSQTSGAKKKDTIADFEKKDGFNILILSPKVAGVGLTITAANHVIHYERWWNPAKEAQATDRVYRIGQKKDVFVYYLIAKDSKGEVITFDETLDKLLMEKKILAKDFLAPIDSDEDVGSRIIEELCGTQRERADLNSRSRPFIVKTIADTADLTPHEFEALVALIYMKRGKDVILCPKVGDEQCDVLFVDEDRITLIQCKHTRKQNPKGIKAIDELQEAFGNYRKDIFSARQRKLQCDRIACTNSRFDKEARQQALDDGIELIDALLLEEMLSGLEISTDDLDRMERERKRSTEQVRRALERL